jgi:hypothetical protein
MTYMVMVVNPVPSYPTRVATKVRLQQRTRLERAITLEKPTRRHVAGVVYPQPLARLFGLWTTAFRQLYKVWNDCTFIKELSPLVPIAGGIGAPFAFSAYNLQLIFHIEIAP